MTIDGFWIDDRYRIMFPDTYGIHSQRPIFHPKASVCCPYIVIYVHRIRCQLTGENLLLFPFHYGDRRRFHLQGMLRNILGDDSRSVYNVATFLNGTRVAKSISFNPQFYIILIRAVILIHVVFMTSNNRPLYSPWYCLLFNSSVVFILYFHR